MKVITKLSHKSCTIWFISNLELNRIILKHREDLQQLNPCQTLIQIFMPHLSNLQYTQTYFHITQKLINETVFEKKNTRKQNLNDEPLK